MWLHTSAHNLCISCNLGNNTGHSILRLHRIAYSMAWVPSHIITYTSLYHNRNPCSPDNASSRTAVCRMYLLTWVNSERIHGWITARPPHRILSCRRSSYRYYSFHTRDYLYTHKRDSILLYTVYTVYTVHLYLVYTASLYLMLMWRSLYLGDMLLCPMFSCYTDHLYPMLLLPHPILVDTLPS